MFSGLHDPGDCIVALLCGKENFIPTVPNLLTTYTFDLAGNSVSGNVSVVVDNAIVCTVYSCPNPPPPPTEPPPDPVTPDGTSPDGEFEGVVTNVDLQASTVSVDSGGSVVTVKITSETDICRINCFQYLGDTYWSCSAGGVFQVLK